MCTYLTQSMQASGSGNMSPTTRAEAERSDDGHTATPVAAGASESVRAASSRNAASQGPQKPRPITERPRQFSQRARNARPIRRLVISPSGEA